MPQKRPASPPPPLLAAPLFSTSAPINDRASKFIAHYSPRSSAKALQSDPSFHSADHRIAAWRIPSLQQTLATTNQSAPKRLYDTGYDDDGEKYAGKRLLRVLEETASEGAVVVARWYGGVMLGPVRFDHIERCARDAITKWNREHGVVEPQGLESKRQKVLVDPVAEKEKLIDVLHKRDESISILRDLLKQKTSGENQAIDKPTSQQPATPKKELNYEKMPLDALKKLEKARDATLSWILAQIDKAEKELQHKKEHGVPSPEDKTQLE